ncbi:putative retinol dehydrogenase 12 [Xylaria bambusicola]|uniref:putative retinol dehydrogenase 12 n=1 Tax=Xylaria bambusicola TaxID=326684 RepID=UPI002007D8EB|nr:putative retinol dehydrogenase 12 [Xylaria bambusicola]KAI0525979.1 putative retinol dehydrogenase 12 [Xylaria bambusicola]
MSAYDRNTEGLELVHKLANNVKDRNFLITGPTPGGLGAETAISIAAGKPAMIILVGRSQAKAQPTIDAIKAVDPNSKVKFVVAELSSLKSVRTAAQTILNDNEISKIDVVINNAAVMASPQMKTEDGLDYQFEINHLSQFVLTNTIMPKILAAGPGARIVNVTSSGHRYTGVRLHDPNFTEPGSYSEFAGYGQAKTANILYSVELNKRLASRGIHAYAPHPGSISTNLQVYLQALGGNAMQVLDDASWKVNGCSMEDTRKRDPTKTLQQGCASLIRAAIDSDLVNEEGVFINDVNLTTDPKDVKPWATDPELAEKCWKLSEELVGEKFDI